MTAPDSGRVESWLVIHYPDGGPSCTVGPMSDPETLGKLSDFVEDPERECEGRISVDCIHVSRDIVDNFFGEFEGDGQGDCPDCYTFDPATKTYTLTERGRGAIAEVRERNYLLIQRDPATGCPRVVAIDE